MWSRRVRSSRPGGNVPELDVLVVACGRQRLAVGRECEGLDRVVVPFDRDELTALRQLPDLDLPALLRMTSAGGHQASVQRECDRSGDVGESVQKGDRRSRTGVGESDAPVASGGKQVPVRVVGNREDLRPGFRQEARFWAGVPAR